MKDDALEKNNLINQDSPENSVNKIGGQAAINDTAILSSIMESTADLIFSVNQLYFYTSFNTSHKQQIKKLFNIDIKIGDSFFAPLNNNDKNLVKSNFDKVLNGEHFRKLVTTQEETGTKLFFDVIHSPIKDLKNNIVGVAVVAKDITTQKNSFEQVTQLSQAVEQSPVSIVITDTNGTIEYVNRKGIEITGYQNDELIGQNPRILSTGEKSKEEYKQLWDTLISGNTWKGEFHNRKKNGELYWESATISPIQDENGEILKYLAIKEDITERKLVEKELIDAKEKAEEINRIKNAFLSNISHELRTPLVGILGFADILENMLEDLELKSMASSILNSGKRLLNTLTSLLSLTELESIKGKLQLDEIEINHICEDVFNTFRTHSLNKSISFNLSLNNEPIILNLNNRLLRESINQLLKNAEIYTEHGSIQLSTHIKAMPLSDTNYGVIELTDTGIGIPEDKIDVVFEEFRQASEGVGREFEGTGLGLTLTKKYVELMGGSIELKSQKKLGTKVSLFFPITAQEIFSPDKYDKVNISNYNNSVSDIDFSSPIILIVENEEINKIFLEKCISKIGKYSSVSTGYEAINYANSQNYDLILMDINLGSGIDGIQTTLELRKIEKYKQTPIVAMTAYTDPENIENFLSNGFTHYIAKPFLTSELLKLIESITTNK